MQQTARRQTPPLPWVVPIRGLVGLLRRYQAGQERHRTVVLTVQVLYAALFSGWLLYTHTWPAPDIVAIFLLLFALLAARGVAFLRDWSPFLVLLLGYAGLTGIAGGLTAHAHVQFPIDADRALFFGHLPTTELQRHLWDADRLQWYDYLATVLYPLHFVVPLVLAFSFWLWRRRLYWRFVGAYLLLCYSGFVTYVLYPMAPPWYAADEGRIPAVASILGDVRYGGVANPTVLASRFFQVNPVAAMPSLHAAFPVLVWLVLWRVWPKWGWATVVYPLAMTFAVVYMGEHYVIDCLAGWLYALVAFAVIWGPGRQRWPAAGRRRRGLRTAWDLPGSAGFQPVGTPCCPFPDGRLPTADCRTAPAAVRVSWSWNDGDEHGSDDGAGRGGDPLCRPWLAPRAPAPAKRRAERRDGW